MNAVPPGTRLCLIGAGGFGRQVLALLEACAERESAFGDVVFAGCGAEIGKFLGPYPIIDTSSVGPGDRFVVTVSDAGTRRRLAALAEELGAAPHSLAAASARISRFAQIGSGAVVCDFAVVEPDARIGRHFHANVRAFIAHECVIGDFVTFAPNAICNGNVYIGDGAYIGAGAIIRQGTPDMPTRIGAGATIGMGAVVTREVPAGAVVVGNPARILER